VCAWLSGRARGPRAGAAAGAPDAALERAHARRAARGAAVLRRGCAQAPAPCRAGMRRRRRGHPVPGSALQLSAVSGGDPVQASLMLPASRALPPRQGLSDWFRQRERLCTEGRSCLVQRWHLRCAVKQTPVWRRDVAGGRRAQRRPWPPGRPASSWAVRRPCENSWGSLARQHMQRCV